MNTGAGTDELLTHGHKEGIEDIQLFVLHPDEATIKTATKLHHLCLLPCLVQCGRITAELRTRLHRIASTLITKDRLPCLSKGCLEFVGGNRNLTGRQDGRLRGNGIIMLINQFLLVNGLTRHIGFGQNGKSRLCQFIPDQVLGRPSIRMRFDEHKCGVFMRFRFRFTFLGSSTADVHQITHFPNRRRRHSNYCGGEEGEGQHESVQ
mmetsp:Transcript_50335/g.56164  ORF Transcript_50335/g.56164 Transcript_50335/m.56164 type:complete len:207 (-) Transcript_50335:39-659(-)